MLWLCSPVVLWFSWSNTFPYFRFSLNWDFPNLLCGKHQSIIYEIAILWLCPCVVLWCSYNNTFPYFVIFPNSQFSRICRLVCTSASIMQSPFITIFISGALVLVKQGPWICWQQKSFDMLAMVWWTKHRLVYRLLSLVNCTDQTVFGFLSKQDCNGNHDADMDAMKDCFMQWLLSCSCIVFVYVVGGRVGMGVTR